MNLPTTGEKINWKVLPGLFHRRFFDVVGAIYMTQVCQYKLERRCVRLLIKAILTCWS